MSFFIFIITKDPWQNCTSKIDLESSQTKYYSIGTYRGKQNEYTGISKASQNDGYFPPNVSKVKTEETGHAQASPNSNKPGIYPAKKYAKTTEHGRSNIRYMKPQKTTHFTTPTTTEYPSRMNSQPRRLFRRRKNRRRKSRRHIKKYQ